MSDKKADTKSESEEVKVIHEPDKKEEMPPDQDKENTVKSEAVKLEKLAASFIEDVPEKYRALIPGSLDPVEKISWIKSAQKMGIFGGPATTSGPDSKRPTGKAQLDYSGMSAMELISAGVAE